MRRLEVCGGIAAGKTTLAKLLEPTGLPVVCENFTAVPFLKAFYSDPQAFAFETEMAFLLQHYHQVKCASATDQWLICDFAFVQDRAYANLNLKDNQKRTFNALYRQITHELGPPGIVIHLRCGEREELRRIEARARSEEAHIDIDYLAKLNAAVAQTLTAENSGSKSIEIDSERLNFTTRGKHRDVILNMLRGKLGL